MQAACEPMVRLSSFTLAHRLARALWGVVYAFLFRPTPRLLNRWRIFLLRSFGARLERGAVVHPSARIWAPWNLRMGEGACLGPHVDCYACAEITLGAWSVVSQYSFLCGATHDYTLLSLPLTAKPIRIGKHAWICADVFIGPGVSIGEGSVIGARSSVYRDVPPWSVFAGNPARFISCREIRESP